MRRHHRQGSLDTPSHPRDALRPSYADLAALFKTEGAGKAGCRPHPWLACNKKHAAEPQVSRTTGLPRAMVLTLIRALPGDRLSCPRRRAMRKHHRNLVSAPGDQDHTISRPRRCCSSAREMRAATPTRPPLPASYVRDGRETPLLWRRDARRMLLICPTTQHRTRAAK
jgi:hypothetical protein